MTDVTAHKVAEPVTQEDLNAWHSACEELTKIKEKELALRKKISAFFFPNPTEGTNKAPLADGWIIKLTHVVNRTIDMAAVTNLGEEFTAAGIRTDVLIKYKPEVSISNYRSMTEAQRNLFDQALTLRPGTPQVEIVKPKRG